MYGTASTAVDKSCVKCQKRRGQALCGGCEQWFCMQHLHAHRNELSQQMEDLIPKHDQIRENLIDKTGDFGQHPLMLDVDRWEATSIQKIQQTAGEIREQLRKSLDRTKRQIRESLRPITQELLENRETENYSETELQKWLNQLEMLKKELERPSWFELRPNEDEPSPTHISLLQLRMTRPSKALSQITAKTRWSTNGQTVAGGHNKGDALNQLHHPYGHDADDDGTLFIADTYNHRIMRWKPNAIEGEIIFDEDRSEKALKN